MYFEVLQDTLMYTNEKYFWIPKYKSIRQQGTNNYSETEMRTFFSSGQNCLTVFADSLSLLKPLLPRPSPLEPVCVFHFADTHHCLSFWLTHKCVWCPVGMTDAPPGPVSELVPETEPETKPVPEREPEPEPIPEPAPSTVPVSVPVTNPSAVCSAIYDGQVHHLIQTCLLHFWSSKPFSIVCNHSFQCTIFSHLCTNWWCRG